jgi:transposase
VHELSKDVCVCVIVCELHTTGNDLLAFLRTPFVFIISQSLLQKMPRNKEISTEKRAQIVALCKTGMKQTEVGERLGVSQQVVSLTWKKYRDQDCFESAHRSGRPHATTMRTDAMIRRVATIHPALSAKEIQAELPSTPSVRTIQRRLHDNFQLKARRPARKPLLSKKNLRDRMSFCKKYSHWTEEMWKQVLFSDETLFHQFKPFKRKSLNTWWRV